MKTFLIFDERSPSNYVEAVMDLVRDNPGPLAELWNLDKGCWVALGAHRILVTMRFRVRLKREIRRVKSES
jgi:hypothetical protein